MALQGGFYGNITSEHTFPNIFMLEYTRSLETGNSVTCPNCTFIFPYKTFMPRALIVFILVLFGGASSASTQIQHEFRGAWLTTYANIDWPSNKRSSVEVKKAELLSYLDQFEACNLNAVFFQVRPAADAFYQSHLEPWSEWMAGKQGKAPAEGFDPLGFMVEECHRRGMELHAWINPYRAVSSIQYSDISNEHPSKTHPEWCFDYGKSRYFHPGLPAVRAHLQEVVVDILEHYDVDGIHFDDYFYPYSIKGEEIPDQDHYAAYASEGQSLEDWRRHNIDLLIQETQATIRSVDPLVKFGVSPLAIWRNQKTDPTGSQTSTSQTSYDNLFADTKKWVDSAWVDYMVPQLYWSTSHKSANFNHLLDWWAGFESRTHIYVGHAIYKLQNPKSEIWKSLSELEFQLDEVRGVEGLQGSAFYRASTFEDNPLDVVSSFSEGRFSEPALVPPMPWIDATQPAPPEVIRLETTNDKLQIQLKERDGIRGFILYSKSVSQSTDSSLKVICRTGKSEIVFPPEEGQTYFISCYNRGNLESELISIEVD